jgi:hypothetical protein
MMKKCWNTQVMDDDLHVLEFLDIGGPMSFMYTNSQRLPIFKIRKTKVNFDFVEKNKNLNVHHAAFSTLV